jgi:hypothetical protein
MIAPSPGQWHVASHFEAVRDVCKPLRVYAPETSVLDGSYRLPAV